MAAIAARTYLKVSYFTYLFVTESIIVDISRQPIVEKFSFIYTLTLSGFSDSERQNSEQNDNLDCQNMWESTAHPVNKDGTRSNFEDLSEQTDSQKTAAAKTVSSAIALSNDANATIPSQWYDLEPAANFNLDLSAITPSVDAAAQEKYSQSKRNYLSKILLVGSCGYLISVMWGLFGHHSQYLSAIIRGQQPIILSQTEAEFIDYMERSLAVIDARVEDKDADAERDTRDSQIVYVPVFTPQKPTTPPPVASPPIPTSPESASSEPLDVVKIPSPPPLPAATPIPESQKLVTNSNSESATNTNNQPSVEHTLIGILELGNKPAALFKIGGATKQVGQGQEIASSGWILDSINGGDIQISHQGMIRTLSVGEKF